MPSLYESYNDLEKLPIRSINNFILTLGDVALVKRSFNKTEEYPIGVYVLPKILDEKVAMLQLSTMDVELTTMTDEQSKYYNVPPSGPFKSDQYRY